MSGDWCLVILFYFSIISLLVADYFGVPGIKFVSIAWMPVFLIIFVLVKVSENDKES